MIPDFKFAASKIDCVRYAVDVLPFVPVMPISFSRFAGFPCQLAAISDSAIRAFSVWM